MWTLVAVRAEAAIVNVTLDDGTPIIVGGAVAPRAPQRADCYEQLHGRGGDNHPTFEDAFVATRVNLGLGYEQALRIHAELPGDARPADDPGHRYPVRGPGRRGAATSPSERREG